MNKLIKNIRIILILFSITFSIKTSYAQYTEYEVKAAYIFSFVKFLHWENTKINNLDTITLGIYKNDPFGNTIDNILLGRKSNGKYWKILRVTNIKDVYKCNIIFISDIEKYELGFLLKKIKNKPILSIGDAISDFCEIGGIINFTPQYSQQQFEINNKLATKSGIIISPKLLKLSKIVSYNAVEF